MIFSAKARYLRYSPYKLRPLVDVIRGKNAAFALGWLSAYNNQRAVPVKNLMTSVVANAQQLQQCRAEDLIVKDIRVDQGPTHKYFKPGAQGRAMPQRRRLCHMSVIVELKK